MRQMSFLNNYRNERNKQLLSDSLNNRDTNNTNRLYGGVSYDTLRSNVSDYVNDNQEYQNKNNSPSLSGMYGTAQTIGNYMSGEGGEGGGGIPWGAIGSMAKTGYDSFMGTNPSEYSDTEQAIIYPLYGASKGASTGNPWAALGGALYGLGYSFKDDLGLEDNEWYTDLLFPIGMGDEHQGLGISL